MPASYRRGAGFLASPIQALSPQGCGPIRNKIWVSAARIRASCHTDEDFLAARMRTSFWNYRELSKGSEFLKSLSPCNDAGRGELLLPQLLPGSAILADVPGCLGVDDCRCSDKKIFRRHNLITFDFQFRPKNSLVAAHQAIEEHPRQQNTRIKPTSITCVCGA